MAKIKIKKVWFFMKVPKHLKTIFKTECYRRETDMTKELIKFMKDFISKKR